MKVSSKKESLKGGDAIKGEKKGNSKNKGEENIISHNFASLKYPHFWCIFPCQVLVGFVFSFYIFFLTTKFTT